MTDLPAINSLLYIVVREDVNFRTRIEDASWPLFSIGAPIGAGDLDVPDEGADLEVFWTGLRARYVLPVEMVGRTRERPARWHLRATGEPIRQTRRSYVRGSTGGIAEITPLGGSERETFAGQIVDLSEAGLRCRVDADFPAGQLVVVQLGLETRTLQLKGKITSTRTEPAEPGLNLVVTYQPSEPDAQAIRRYVFKWEIAERRRQLGLS